MKRLALLSLLLCGHAYAAITFDTEIGFQGSTPLTSAAFSTSISAGEDIVVQTGAQNNPASGTPTSADVVITDSVDHVNFTACGFRWNPTNNTYVAVYHHQALASGSRTLTVATTNSVFNLTTSTVFTGFTGTATCDTLNVAGGSNSSVATSALTPATTGHNNTVAVYAIVSNSFSGTPASGYTIILSSGPTGGWNIQATSGASVPVSITWNASTVWDGVLAGVYDATGGGAPSTKQFLVQ